MTRRKIQLVGGGTYSVSLPKGWAESQGVEPGDEVSLHAHLDGVLVVETDAAADDQSGGGRVDLPVDGADPTHAGRLLRAAYAAGVDRATIEAEDGFSVETRREIERTARGLTGTTVADGTDSEITAATPLDPSEVSIRQSVRHLSFVALSTHRDATAAVLDGGSHDAVVDRGDQARRLHALVDRHFRRSLSRLDEVDALGLTRPELFDLWTTSRELERVARRATELAETARRLDDCVDERVGADLRECARDARDVVEAAVDVVVDERGIASARGALVARDDLREATGALDRRLFESDGADPRLTAAVDAVGRTADHGAAIAEAGLRAAVRRADTAADDGSRVGDGVGVTAGDDD
ncbi:AbrB/MazE/SpoVT family DNA-binding domain-containing protein [Halobaculum roseum]|uniref:AbrB/MazE/SpoVT family DNA-binding domain-containing protein n=1 Tax=Halobaculum roseum TaxID=2175149 RepID=A0ABD5MH70_9EURY|nr:AbrB/MazE/SpoVT family DNA-binding domain-containing protein [Halobaculum roseum]QZY02267.1 phosphate uptake regulator PhoU [Halobaculum roseum]